MTVDEELLAGQHGFAVKFLYEYTKESLPKLDELLYGNQGTSYDVVYQKFVVLCQTYLRDLKKNEQKKTSKIAQKQQQHLVTVKTERKSVAFEADCEVNSKKRDISNVDDGNNHEHHKAKKSKKVKKLVKSKKPKKKCSEVANTTADMVRKNTLDDSTTTTITETVTTTTKTTKLCKKTSSVKLNKKASSRSSLHISQSKLTKLKSKSKKKSSLAKQQQRITNELASSNSLKPVGDFEAQDSMRPIASSSIASYSVKSEPMVPIVPAVIATKTPSKAVHKNLLAIIEASSAKKTGTKAGDEAASALTASGKVKQMVEMVEARLKTPGRGSPSLLKTPMSSKQPVPTPTGTITRSVARNLFNSNSVRNNIKQAYPSTDTKVKQVNNPIDNRKQRLSARIDAKRNSLKQVNAFLKDASNAESIESESSVARSVKKHVNPPVVKSLFSITSNSASVKQNYKLVSKTSSGKLAIPSSSNNPMTKRTSFIKFLERNTPSKLTNTELKLDMVAREEQNQRRLEEQKKQTQEKIELAKKKREEKMRKINELKAKKAESDLKRQEEIEAKLREVEENKRRIMEEKRKEREAEKQRVASAHTVANKATEQVSSAKPVLHSKIPTTSAQPLNTFSTHHNLNAVSQSHQQQNQKEVFKQPTLPEIPAATATKENHKPYENLSALSHGMKPQPQNKTPAKHNYVLPQINPECKPPMHDNQQPKTPLSTFGQNLKVSNSSSKNGTPYKEVQKVKVYENYSIQELESGDETDDDEQPNKPIPQWAKNPALMNKVKNQGLMMINFTKLFKSSANSNIVLEDIFKIKRKNFTERSSSAFWSSPPVWRTNGLTGDESFRRMK